MKKIIKLILIILILGTISLFSIDAYVKNTGKKYLYQNITKYLPNKQTALILGAKVYENGQMSDMLLDRVQTAIELHQQGKVEKILVSGDHGRENYDEVNAVKKYLLEQNIFAEDIFLDHAGFDTYDSIYRAKEVFQVDSLIIVTQKFHLPRALYIAQGLNIDAVGVAADKHIYISAKKSELREIPARFKAYLNIILKAQPKFLGETIPITGDSLLSWD
jgi:SanA protein